MIILGDYAVGKTSLICRYIDGKFQQQDSVSTVTEREGQTDRDTHIQGGGGGEWEGEKGRRRDVDYHLL